MVDPTGAAAVPSPALLTAALPAPDDCAVPVCAGC
ncbi:hypothetical protein ABH925_006041 [Streptacidiphilus sp. EB129]|jgi:hypothetical protein